MALTTQISLKFSTLWILSISNFTRTCQEIWQILLKIHQHSYMKYEGHHSNFYELRFVEQLLVKSDIWFSYDTRLQTDRQLSGCGPHTGPSFCFIKNA